MQRPYVVAINSVSGGGKTALSRLVQEALPDSVLFSFDDYDSTNRYPDDYYAWTIRGADLNEFDCVGMRAAVDRAVRNKGAQYIVLDYPFGRDHPRFADLIDLSVFIDTPLDVAMARRILRDYISSSNDSAEDRWSQLKADLEYYLRKARYPYLDTNRHKSTSDLILDGWSSLEALRDQILDAVRAEVSRRS